MFQRFLRFSEFAEFTQFPFHLGKNSIKDARGKYFELAVNYLFVVINYFL